jgi:hypothetical protein
MSNEIIPNGNFQGPGIRRQCPISKQQYRGILLYRLRTLTQCLGKKSPELSRFELGTYLTALNHHEPSRSVRTPSVPVAQAVDSALSTYIVPSDQRLFGEALLHYMTDWLIISSLTMLKQFLATERRCWAPTSCSGNPEIFRKTTAVRLKFVLYVGLSSKCRDSTSDQATTSSSHTFLNSLIILLEDVILSYWERKWKILVCFQ